MAKHFETVTCQATFNGMSREFKLYVRRSDEKDIDYDDQAYLRFWASKRVQSPLYAALATLAETIKTGYRQEGIDGQLKSRIVAIREGYANDQLDGMKEKPVFIIRVLPEGPQISYEVFESN